MNESEVHVVARLRGIRVLLTKAQESLRPETVYLEEELEALLVSVDILLLKVEKERLLVRDRAVLQGLDDQ